jgi:hypothetical protein
MAWNTLMANRISIERSRCQMNKLTPAWFLFLFAPITAEYLSGSSPFQNPIVLVANMILYGCGILLIREIKVRWHASWLAVFILSIAYTVLEEGLMLNTLFDPTKNTVGRFIGVNWVWTTGMLVVHSLISVLPPILVAEAAYANKAREPWLKLGTFWLILALFMANVFGLGHAFAPHNRPGCIYFIVELGIVSACLVAARYLPATKLENEFPFRSPRWYYFAFLIGTTATLAAGFAVPALPLPTLAKIGIMLAVYGAFLWIAQRNQAFSPILPPLSRLACASGIISFWILVSPVAIFMRHSFGPLVIAVLMSIFLLSQRNRLVSSIEV